MNYKTTGNSNFRFTEVILSLGNAFVSSCLKLTISMAILMTSAVQSEEKYTNADEIETAVAQHISHSISVRAQQSQWQNYHLDTVIRVPSSAKHLPNCSKSLVVTGVDNKVVPVGTLKRSVSCEDSANTWRINVTVKASLTLDVVVAKSGINRDEPISENLVQLERRTLSREVDFFTHIPQVINQTAKRRIRTGQILSSRKLASQALIEKGNQVVITAAKNGFIASTKGVALEEGQYGNQIDVRNTSSGKVIKAVVTGLNQVQTQF